MDGLERATIDIEGAKAMALTLEADGVGAIVLGDEDRVTAHVLLSSTGRIVEVSLGRSFWDAS
jgi:F0F1-type ATP synthase alpha subunit